MLDAINEKMKTMYNFKILQKHGRDKTRPSTNIIWSNCCKVEGHAQSCPERSLKTGPARNHNAGFTLSEVLVAAALSSLVMAMFLALLVKSLGLWRDGMARLQLSEHSHITRERVLHGINGQFGLRHANRAQVIYSASQITFSEISTTATNNFTLFLNKGQAAAYSDSAGQHRLLHSRTFVEQVSITNSGNFLNIDLTLAMTNGWKKYTQPQQIRVYLLNE